MPSPNGIEGAKEDLGSEHDPLNDHMEELQEKFKTLHQVRRLFHFMSTGC